MHFQYPHGTPCVLTFKVPLHGASLNGRCCEARVRCPAVSHLHCAQGIHILPSAGLCGTTSLHPCTACHVLLPATLAPQGLWRGTVPGLLLTVPYTAVQFVALQQVRQAAASCGLTGAQEKGAHGTHRTNR